VWARDCEAYRQKLFDTLNAASALRAERDALAAELAEAKRTWHHLSDHDALIAELAEAKQLHDVLMDHGRMAVDTAARATRARSAVTGRVNIGVAMQIHLNIEELKNLLVHARAAGTVDRWADVAIEWMLAAEAEIKRLRDLERSPK
jgi:hypothetical protein